MNVEDKVRILKHITLGTDEVLHYPYNGGKEPLPLRPLSSFELDQCFYNALDNCENPKVAPFVIKYRVGLIKGEREIEVSNEGFNDILKFHNEVNYWVVYYSMKDFQDSEFSLPDYDELEGYPKGFYIVKQMQEVHDIADFILHASTQNEDVIKEIFEDEYGREIAYVVYYLNIPLDKFSKLTRLQRRYLIYSKGNLHKYKYDDEDLKKKGYILSGDVMTAKELLDRLK